MLAGLAHIRGSCSVTSAGRQAGKQAGGWEGQDCCRAMPAGRDRTCKDKEDRTGAHLLWPSCSVSSGDWQWASSELWCGQCTERAGIFPDGVGPVGSRLCTVQVRSLPLQPSQILVSLAEGMGVLEASPVGCMCLLPSPAVARAVGFRGGLWWG